MAFSPLRAQWPRCFQALNPATIVASGRCAAIRSVFENNPPKLHRMQDWCGSEWPDLGLLVTGAVRARRFGYGL